MNKYALKETALTLCKECVLRLVEVEDAYALVDRLVARKACQPEAERFPYWAEIWPASVALARWFYLNEPKPASLTVELGCGIGLVGIALARLGRQVEATDFVEDALIFATYNAQLNKAIGHHRVSYLDWRNPVGAPVECMVAADIVYERRNHPLLLRLLHQRLRPGGCFYLSDPGRPTAGSLVNALRDQGYDHRQERLVQPWIASNFQVDIHIFRRPAP